MTFTKNEMSAIAKLAVAMANADGKVEKNELAYIALEMVRFGVKDSDSILEEAAGMEASTALAIVSNMTTEEKKYVTAYLGALMASDGNIDNKELALWKLVSTLCELPTMSVKEAVNYVMKMN